MNIKNLVQEMTIEEKASLCSGADFWHTQSVERLGVPSIMMTDGPHGLRKQSADADHIGVNLSIPATCFPTASASACSWDIDLLHQMGEALGEECLQEEVSVILGPGANIKRSPLCGRNFEYISEDPLLSGTMAAALIRGVQSKGVGTSLKHYAMNNQETKRLTIDAVVDERAQREIYLASFEIAVRQAQPWTVMCSYNMVDGTYVSDNKKLLTDILKQEWGHTGIVVTDWGACNDRVQGIKSALELEMPSSNGINDERIVDAVKSGKISIQELDRVVVRILGLVEKSIQNARTDYKYDIQEHRDLAKRVAQSSAVLLKNDDILPLTQDVRIAVIGEFAQKPRYQGAGSSLINPHRVDNICQILQDRDIEYQYARGYDIGSGEIQQDLIDDAIAIAEQSDIVVVLAGLTPEYESEGFDRRHLNLPLSHNELIYQVAEASSRLVVVLQNGAPVAMPWLDDVDAVLETYLCGEAGAAATVDILFGDVNPSGKLAETFPLRLPDNPSYRYFPGGDRTVEYRESIYVGYRYYDKAGTDVLFPFGHGLSYTSYEYSDVYVAQKGELDYEVSVTVENTGDIAGAEIVQLYIGNNDSPIFKAEKELRAYTRVYLEPKQKATVTLTLDKRSFAYYNIGISNWHVDSGIYTVLVGASSRDIRLTVDIDIVIDDSIVVANMADSLPSYYDLPRGEFLMDDEQFAILLGRDIPPSARNRDEPYSILTTLGDIQDKLIGRIIIWLVQRNMKKSIPADAELGVTTMRMYDAIAMEMPLRSFAMLADGRLPKYFADGLVDMLNGKLLRGLGKMRKK